MPVETLSISCKCITADLMFDDLDASGEQLMITCKKCLAFRRVRQELLDELYIVVMHSESIEMRLLKAIKTVDGGQEIHRTSCNVFILSRRNDEEDREQFSLRMQWTYKSVQDRMKLTACTRDITCGDCPGSGL